MTRTDPAFDERSYGFSSFVEFLNECHDLISIIPGENDHLISLSEKGSKLVDVEKTGSGRLMILEKKKKEMIEEEDEDEIFEEEDEDEIFDEFFSRNINAV